MHNGKRFFTFSAFFSSVPSLRSSRHTAEGRKGMRNVHYECIGFVKISRWCNRRRLVIRQARSRSFINRTVEQTDLLSTKRSECFFLIFFLRSTVTYLFSRFDSRVCTGMEEENIWVFKINKRMNDPQCKRWKKERRIDLRVGCYKNYVAKRIFLHISDRAHSTIHRQWKISFIHTNKRQQ